MMRLLFILIFFFPNFVQAQNLRVLANLSPEISESSGLIKIEQDTLWTINDSDNPARLFAIDTLGNVLKTLQLDNFPNQDWEELASDTADIIYIGDIGNNDNSRSDLRIGIVNLKDAIDTVSAEFINFSYSDQKFFPPSSKDKNFDCEAFFVFRDSLYLFSKNWSSPFTGTCKMYVMPKAPGTYVAQLVDSVVLGSIALINQVTAADIRGNEFALLGSATIWTFNFLDVPRFSNRKNISLGQLSQKEGICYASSNSFYISEERIGQEANLYHFSTGATSTSSMMDTDLDVRVFVTNGEIKLVKKDKLSLSYAFHNQLGQRMKQGDLSSAQTEMLITTDNWEPGIYYLRVELESLIFETTKLFVP